MAPLRQFFKYFGSKKRLSQTHYPPPRYDTIVEPFAGSACYSLTYPDRRIVLYEKDPVIAGIWRYLIGAAEADVLALPDIGLGESPYDRGLEPGAANLIGMWLEPSPSKPPRRAGKWSLNSNCPGGTMWSAFRREVLAGQLRAIRHWEVRNCSYEDAPDIDATWFVDPPYQGAGKKYTHGSSGIDFAALGNWCIARRGQAIVCEGRDAAWLPFRHLGDIRTSRQREVGSGYRARELVWLSDEHRATP